MNGYATAVSNPTTYGLGRGGDGVAGPGAAYGNGAGGASTYGMGGAGGSAYGMAPDTNYGVGGNGAGAGSMMMRGGAGGTSAYGMGGAGGGGGGATGSNYSSSLGPDSSLHGANGMYGNALLGGSNLGSSMGGGMNNSMYGGGMGSAIMPGAGALSMSGNEFNGEIVVSKIFSSRRDLDGMASSHDFGRRQDSFWDHARPGAGTSFRTPSAASLLGEPADLEREPSAADVTRAEPVGSKRPRNLPPPAIATKPTPPKPSDEPAKAPSKPAEVHRTTEPKPVEAKTATPKPVTPKPAEAKPSVAAAQPTPQVQTKSRELEPIPLLPDDSEARRNKPAPAPRVREPEPAKLLPDEEADIPLLVDDVRPVAPPRSPQKSENPIVTPSPDRTQKPTAAQSGSSAGTAVTPQPHPQPQGNPSKVAKQPEQPLPPGPVTPAMPSSPHPAPNGTQATTRRYPQSDSTISPSVDEPSAVKVTKPAQSPTEARISTGSDRPVGEVLEEIPLLRDDERVPETEEAPTDAEDAEGEATRTDGDEGAEETEENESTDAEEAVPTIDDEEAEETEGLEPDDAGEEEAEEVREREPTDTDVEDRTPEGKKSFGSSHAEPDRTTPAPRGPSAEPTHKGKVPEHQLTQGQGTRGPPRPTLGGASAEPTPTTVSNKVGEMPERTMSGGHVTPSLSQPVLTTTEDTKEPAHHRPGSRRPVRPQSRALSIDEAPSPDADDLEDDLAHEVATPKVDPVKAAKERVNAVALKTDSRRKLKEARERCAEREAEEKEKRDRIVAQQTERAKAPRDEKELARIKAVMEERARQVQGDEGRAPSGGKSRRTGSRRSGSGLRGPIPDQPPDETAGEIVEEPPKTLTVEPATEDKSPTRPHSRLRKTPTGASPGLRGPIPEQPHEVEADAIVDTVERPHSRTRKTPTGRRPGSALRGAIPEQPPDEVAGEMKDGLDDDNLSRPRSALSQPSRPSDGPTKKREGDARASPQDPKGPMSGITNDTTSGDPGRSDSRNHRRKTPTGRRPGSSLRGEIPDQPPDEAHGEIDDTAEGIKDANKRSPTHMTATGLGTRTVAPEYLAPSLPTRTGTGGSRAAPGGGRNSWSGPVRRPAADVVPQRGRVASLPVSSTSTPKSTQPPLKPAAFVRPQRSSTGSLKSPTQRQVSGAPLTAQARVPPPPRMSPNALASPGSAAQGKLPPLSPSSTSSARALAPIAEPRSVPSPQRTQIPAPQRTLFSPPAASRGSRSLPPVEQPSQQSIRQPSGQTPATSQQRIAQPSGQTPATSQQSIRQPSSQTPATSQQSIHQPNGQTPATSQRNMPPSASPEPLQGSMSKQPLSSPTNSSPRARAGTVEKNPVRTLVLVEEITSSNRALEYDDNSVRYNNTSCTVTEVKQRSEGSFDYQSTVVREVREAICAGYNAAVLSNEAPNTASRFDSPVWPILNRIVRSVLDQNADENGQLNANFTLCCALGFICDDKVKDLLAEDEDSPFEKMSVHPSPIYGPRIPQLRYGQITSGNAFEGVLSACLTRASDNAVLSSMDRGVATAFLLLKQVREENGVKDVYLSSILVSSAGSDIEPYASGLSKAANDYASVFHLVLGGPCLTCYMLNTADDDTVNFDGTGTQGTQQKLAELMDLLSDMAGFDNYRLRSGSVKRFIKYVEKANAKARMKLESAKDAASRKQLEKYVRDQERLLGGATRMLRAAGV